MPCDLSFRKDEDSKESKGASKSGSRNGIEGVEAGIMLAEANENESVTQPAGLATVLEGIGEE